MVEEKTLLERLLEQKGHDVHTIEREESVLACVAKMNELRVGAFLIVENEELVGIVTERDIIRKVVGKQCNGGQFKVKDIMTTELTTVTPQTTVTKAMNIITTSRIRHLPVVKEGNHVAGLISIGDLVNWVIHQQQRHIEELTNYISG
ncbi:MAG: CBS domain-containing protein [Gammaproteobacteria bacterium]|nr:CBS domain-containing protein [Gammaproteobacteria bacterium]